MEWTGEGILLSARPHGESAALIEVLAEGQGLHAGIVRGGAGRRMAPLLQPGAQLHLTWRARLEAHLGQFTIEPIRARAAAILHDADRLAALNALCALLRFSLPERDPQPRLYGASHAFLDRLAAGRDWQAGYLHWERVLLEECGYGLDLGSCAVSGATEGLAYVSPRTGCAVTAQAAGEWASKLLPLPPLLADPALPDDRAQMRDGLATTGFFLARVLAPSLGERPLPEARARLEARFG
ncbi:MAG: DNA repair protein RecO [Pararhodobacter sp.]